MVISERDGVLFRHNIIDKNIMDFSEKHRMLINEASKTQSSF